MEEKEQSFLKCPLFKPGPSWYKEQEQIGCVDCYHYEYCLIWSTYQKLSEIHSLMIKR